MEKWHFYSSIERAIARASYYDLVYRMFGRHRVKFTKIEPWEWRMEWPLQAKRLFSAAKRAGYMAELFKMELYDYHAPKDIDLVLFKNGRHVIGWYPQSEQTVVLEMIYRWVPYEEGRDCKARDLVIEFIELSRKAGFKAVVLWPEPFNLTPRLPYRTVADDPDQSPQMEVDELRKLYESMGFRGSERMTLVLQVPSALP